MRQDDDDDKEDDAPAGHFRMHALDRIGLACVRLGLAVLINPTGVHQPTMHDCAAGGGTVMADVLLIIIY